MKTASKRYTENLLKIFSIFMMRTMQSTPLRIGGMMPCQIINADCISKYYCIFAETAPVISIVLNNCETKLLFVKIMLLKLTFNMVNPLLQVGFTLAFVIPIKTLKTQAEYCTKYNKRHSHHLRCPFLENVLY